MMTFVHMVIFVVCAKIFTIMTAQSKGQILMNINRKVHKPTWGLLSNRNTPSPTGII